MLYRFLRALQQNRTKSRLLYLLIGSCFSVHYRVLYNNPSYSRILIGSCLWSIRGQMHDWRHHERVFASAILKWRKVLRIRIIFYVTGQMIRYKNVWPRHWTGSRSQKTKDKAVSFRKWYRNNLLAASVGSRARLNHAQTCWSWWADLEFNKPNKQNVSEINLFKKNLLFPVSKQLLTRWLMSGMKYQNITS